MLARSDDYSSVAVGILCCNACTTRCVIFAGSSDLATAPRRVDPKDGATLRVSPEYILRPLANYILSLAQSFPTTKFEFCELPHRFCDPPIRSKAVLVGGLSRIQRGVPIFNEKLGSLVEKINKASNNSNLSLRLLYKPMYDDTYFVQNSYLFSDVGIEKFFEIVR